MEKHITIAIDGPSGAGKSTLAKALAKKFGFIYVDTGALYRTVGLYVRRMNVNPDDAEAIAKILDGAKVGLCYRDGGQRVLLGEEDVSDAIRTPEASDYASRTSVHPCVRKYLLETQRKLARENSVIMDGRDIGTVVLPDATVKLFLTASPEERAKRRFLELQEKHIEQSYEDVLKDIQERDYRDTHRAESPLKRAEDAVDADTTSLNLEESLELMEKLVREKTGL